MYKVGAFGVVCCVLLVCFLLVFKVCLLALTFVQAGFWRSFHQNVFWGGWRRERDGYQSFCPGLVLPLLSLCFSCYLLVFFSRNTSPLDSSVLFGVDAGVVVSDCQGVFICSVARRVSQKVWRKLMSKDPMWRQQGWLVGDSSVVLTVRALQVATDMWQARRYDTTPSVVVGEPTPSGSKEPALCLWAVCTLCPWNAGTLSLPTNQITVPRDADVNWHYVFKLERQKFSLHQRRQIKC